MKRFLALCLTLAMLLPAVVLSVRAEDPGTIRVRTAEELMELAVLCVGDTWSAGKTVVLENDIDLTGQDFSPIPLWNGVFDGQGHTIRGLSLTESMSPAGLFRQVLADGEVKNLHVSGCVTPDGAGEKIGGIAGIVAGKIENCTFTGSVSGKSAVGGIAGSLGKGGAILSCKVSGSVDGEHRIGGIAGESEGRIADCESAASTGCAYTVVRSAQTIDLTLSGEELIDITDIGGIAGRNAGTITGCRNTGDVGYPRTGYNIGGIAGRQSGVISSSENRGEVNGRKDVGGIVGQAEPDGVWSFSGSAADDLREQLDELQSRLNTLFDDTSDSQKQLSEDILRLTDSLNEAEAAAHAMTGEAEDWINDNIAVVNSVGDRVRSVLSDFAPVGDSLADAASCFSEAVRLLTDAIVAAREASAPAEEGLNALSDSLTVLRDAADRTEKTAEALASSVGHLREAGGDPAEMQKDIQAIFSGFTEFAGSFRAFTEAAEDLSDGTYSDADALIYNTASRWDAVVQSVSGVADSFERITAELDTVLTVSYHLAADCDEEEIEAGLGEMQNALSRTKEITGGLADQIEAVREVLAGDHEDLRDLTEQLSEVSLDGYYTALNAVETAAGELIEAVRHLRNFRGTPAERRAMWDSVLWNVDAMLDDLRCLSAYTAQAVRQVGQGSAETSRELEAALYNLNLRLSEVLETVEDAADAMEKVGFAAEDAAEELNLEEADLALADLETALGTAEGLSDDVDTLVDGLQTALPDFAEAMKRFSDGMGMLPDASAKFSEGAAKLGDSMHLFSSVLTSTSSLPPIRFVPLGEDTREAGDALYAALVELNAEVAALASDLSDAAVTADLNRISDQLFAVTGTVLTMLETWDDTEHLDGYASDISDTALDPGKNGTVSSCSNYGSVNAETNAGGIVGCVSIDLSFDREDELDLSSILSGGAKYLIYSAVSQCGNYASVSANKSAAGGIAGRMDYGVAADCVSGGVVEAGESYSGGIVGYSEGTIRRCFARANISAENYAGGIAGYAGNLYSCRAIPELTGTVEFQGSIAGQAAGVVEGNVYANSAVGGVNGFSFSGQSDAVSYEELVAMDGTPEIFRTITVTFVVEDEILTEIDVPFGGSVGELPAVPDKDGMYWKWEDFDADAVWHSLTVTGAYHRPISTLATEEDPPLFFAEGTFYEGQRLTALPFSPDLAGTPQENREVIAAYAVEVTDYDEPITVRMLTDREGSLFSVAPDGTLNALSYKRRGSYIAFTLENGGRIVYLAGRKSLSPWWIAAGGGGALVIAGILVGTRKKRKKTEKKNPPES